MKKTLFSLVIAMGFAACNSAQQDGDALIRQRLEIIRNNPTDQHEVMMLEHYLNMPEGPYKQETRKYMNALYVPMLKALTKPDGSYR
jgi:hypothetical protein